MANKEFPQGQFSYSYRIAKAAQNMLTLCLQQEFEDKGIRVTAIHPGKLKTDIGAFDANMTPAEGAKNIYDWVIDSNVDASGKFIEPGVGIEVVKYDLTVVQSLFGPSKKVLNGLPNALTIEEIEEDIFYNVQTYKEKISRFEEICFNWELKRASIVLNKRFSSYNSSVRMLLDAGFSLYAAKIEVCRELNNVEELERQYTYRSIAEGTLSEKRF